MKASFKGRIVAIERHATEGGNDEVIVALVTSGKVGEAFALTSRVQPEDALAQLRCALTLKPRVADRLVFGADVTIEVEIKDGAS